jgi:hypothetical protein
MMVRECTVFIYPTCDPKDLFVECVTMLTVQSRG